MYFRIISGVPYALALYVIWTYFRTFYLIGYNESLEFYRSIDFDGFLVAEVGIFLLLLLLFVVSFFLKGQRVWMLCLVLLYVPFFNGSWWAFSKCMPNIVDGLNDRILKDYRLDDLRRLAHDCNDQLAGVRTANAALVPLSAQTAAAFDQLKQKYQFLQWMGGASIQNIGGETQVEWSSGSFFWGISIDTSGRYNQDGFRGRDSMVHTIHVGDDIYFFSIGR